MQDASGERQRFGRYETLFRIAGGGMAEVYAARALGEGGFQKLVALKRMRPELAEDVKFVTMFLDEGRVAANIASPNVVSTLDLGRAEDNSLYLVMELVTGAPLSALIAETMARSERIPVDVAVDVIAQAANGLHAAHEARSPTGEPLEIVHRDCSPHNILVDVHGQVKITDFGIAKAMERQTSSHAGEMKGKLQYLSPEQALGLPVDRRADIFILGIVAWEVFAGRQLFAAEHPVEALHKVVTMPIPRLDEEVPGVSADIGAAVHQALQREPNERFATAAAFGNALRNALGERPPPPTEVGAFVRRYGGAALHTVEQRVREALGGKPAEGSIPPPSAEHPIPLQKRVDDPRSRAATLPSQPPTASAEASSDVRLPPPARLPSGPLPSQPQRPSDSDAPRQRNGDEPLVPQTRPTEATPPTPSSPSRPRIRTAALTDEPSAPRGRLKTTPLTAEETRPRQATAPLPKDLPTWHPPPSAPPRRGTGGRLAIFAMLAVVGLGGGAMAAWWASRAPAPEPTTDAGPTDVGPATDPTRPADATPAPAIDPDPAPPVVAEDPAPSPDPTESPEPETAPEPERPTKVASPRPRPRREPVERSPPRRLPPGPGTVGGSDTAPRGDRETAFDEIPWDPR